MTTLKPYLRFNDSKCREAMNFYKDCLGGELELQTVGESGMGAEMGEVSKDKIMHSTLKKNGEALFYASDMMMDVAKIGDNISLCFNGEDEAEFKSYFDKLSVGGEVFQPLQEVPWGAIFGVVTDKYGMEWMFNCDRPAK